MTAVALETSNGPFVEYIILQNVFLFEVHCPHLFAVECDAASFALFLHRIEKNGWIHVSHWCPRMKEPCYKILLVKSSSLKQLSIIVNERKHEKLKM